MSKGVNALKNEIAINKSNKFNIGEKKHTKK